MDIELASHSSKLLMTIKSNQMNCAMGKYVFGRLRTAKAMIRLRMQSAYRIIIDCRFHRRLAKANYQIVWRHLLILNFTNRILERRRAECLQRWTEDLKIVGSSQFRPSTEKKKLYLFTRQLMCTSRRKVTEKQ